MRKYVFVAIALSLPSLAIADALTDAVKTRQEHMKTYGKNIGMLAKMAKGELDYDADAAQAAADTIVEYSTKDQSGYWLPGTSSEDMPGVSYALPALWTDGAKAGEIAKEFVANAAALQAVAGAGQGEMAKALGAAGKNCNDCHKSFQAKKD
ncbi:cytochrome c556 [Aliiruegeria haliotis]|uniref:Cytochrome c556 n=1 Tax=Aliiruegeria haliotis TaxID=1280846 RepID=A0A2T0RP48_9RHOB|nr:cytochrome c [Aliiruegeria haliotis]PRY22976.1 cytochrome c556 [Aliiruegeria haliotis]